MKFSFSQACFTCFISCRESEKNSGKWFTHREVSEDKSWCNQKMLNLWASEVPFQKLYPNVHKIIEGEYFYCRKGIRKCISILLNVIRVSAIKIQKRNFINVWAYEIENPINKKIGVKEILPSNPINRTRIVKLFLFWMHKK